MAQSTRSSGGDGNDSLRPARSPAGGAGTRLPRGRRGTSDTTTSTVPATEAPSTGGATVRRQRMQPNGDVGLVVDAVKRDLLAIGKADPALASSALAALALELARQLDDRENSATSKSMCAGQLRDTLDRLRELMPKAADKDDLDELSKRRAARLARRPKAAS